MRKLSLSDLFTRAVAEHGTQLAIAKKCGLSQAMVSLYLNGKVKTIKAESVIRIARCLGVKPALLLQACSDNGSTTPKHID